MRLVFENTASLFIFGFVGWFISKLKIVDPGHAGMLSALEVNVFLPCMSFRTFSMYCTPDSIREKMPYLLTSVIVLSAMYLVSIVITKFMSKDKAIRNIYRYSLVIPNTGYVGCPLVQSLYGELALFNTMVFVLPWGTFTNTEGYRMLSGDGKVSLKRIFNPMMIGSLLGIAVGLTGLKVPTMISAALDKSTNCVAPISMLLAGMVLYEFPLKTIFFRRNEWIVAVLRLVVIPVAWKFILTPFCDPDVVKIAVMMLAMPCGLNTIVFPKLVGQDCKPGASLALISNLLSMITIPILMSTMF